MPRTPLDILTTLVTRPERIVCGIMSGTSVDAVDVALLRLRGSGNALSLEVLHYSETLYAEELQNRIFANAEVASSNVNDICLLHTALAHVYAAAVRACVHEAGMEIEDVDLIGMHGQTLRHLPAAMSIAGHDVCSTLQIGSGPTLATLLQVPVVYDFRSGDMALGGQGAPLLPYTDALLFSSKEEHRVLLNIGGIANCSILPRGCAAADVVAFDTGPGNMMVDALMRRFYGREFDKDGKVASTGNVHPDLLTWLRQHPYYRQPLPKSTGRELFGEDYLQDYLHVAAELGLREPADLVATAAEITVRSITAQLRVFAEEWQGFRLFVSGGGAHNRYFLEGLRYGLPNARVDSSSALGIDPDAKEAVAFAVLANEWLMGNCAALPGVTGVRRPALLGALAIPA
ncbi:MAG: anhydro-N-acetylmuramic acid kinase [Bacteroidota bacterium]|nr:anhydro-N-acetylmuramic acid kinase [Bacteroidota bacterium]